jgi:hypothetical protein
MNTQNKDLGIYIGSGATGFIVCLGISLLTGRREAWDSGMYFYLGIPVMAIVIFFLAYKNPVKVWRWTIRCHDSSGRLVITVATFHHCYDSLFDSTVSSRIIGS